ncbi:MAG: hypothetical protein ISS01_00145 [Nanoarchaeota archaeon]|nr:hypothetical protein [Nanoarchaeota archaeon]
MEKYIFVLGRDPELSKDELYSYFNCRNIKFNLIEENDLIIILEINSIKAKDVIKNLGGIQKIASVIKNIENLYLGKENKIRYAISNYSDVDVSDLKAELKNYFKKEKLRASIKKSHFQVDYLMPSEAQNVLEIIVYGDYMGKTIAVFNPKEHKHRDLHRPEQRPLHTISIRLAKIMLNLSEVKKGDVVLDPFCGIGTILQEAMIMGVNVIGIDNEIWCVEASKKNLDWIKKEYNTNVNYSVLKGSAKDLRSHVKSVDCVVTEPYLGPFLKKLPTEGTAKRTLIELAPMYSKLIEGLGKVVKKKVVIISPIFRTRSKKELRITTLERDFRKAGFKFKDPYIYSASKSKMLREIWVLSK